jgi:hypothetical protein
LQNKCSYPGCNYPVFSRKLCQRHWKMKWGKPLKRTGKPKQKSEKRKHDEKEYEKICAELDKEARQEKRWICFFCGQPLYNSCDHHHVAGKTGLSDNNISLYLDRDNIILSHRSCHRRYHDITIEQLIKAPYYDRLMKKIYYLCRARYYNMKLKHDRIHDKEL